MSVARAFVAQAMTTALTSRVLWLLIGSANLVVGVMIAVRARQSQDLQLVLSWCRIWLLHGVNPYPGPAATPVNYPPHGLLILSPLAAIPPAQVALVWAVLTVALAVMVARLGVRLLASTGSPRTAFVVPFGIFLAWQAVRVGLGNGQFSLLAMACGLGMIAARSAVLRGALLCVAMIKPQIGIAFALWAIFTGAVAPVVIAGALIAGGTAAFGIRLGASPIGVALDYASVMRSQLMGPELKQGALELGPLLRAWFGRSTTATVLILMFAGGGLAAIGAAHRRIAPGHQLTVLLPLTCLWTLASVYHLTYDGLLMWPVYLAVARHHADTGGRRGFVALLLCLQAFLVVDIPGLWWKLQGRGDVPMDIGGWAGAPYHFDRIMIVVLFGFFLWTAREARA